MDRLQKLGILYEVELKIGQINLVFVKIWFFFEACSLQEHKKSRLGRGCGKWQWKLTYVEKRGFKIRAMEKEQLLRE